MSPAHANLRQKTCFLLCASFTNDLGTQRRKVWVSVEILAKWLVFYNLHPLCVPTVFGAWWRRLVTMTEFFAHFHSLETYHDWQKSADNLKFLVACRSRSCSGWVSQKSRTSSNSHRRRKKKIPLLVRLKLDQVVKACLKHVSQQIVGC